MDLPCIVCDKPLENVMSDVDGNQPYGGTAFTSHGHYGSTVFDCDGGYLEINICAECSIKKRGSIFHVTEKKPIVRQEYEYKPWEPEPVLIAHVLNKAQKEQ